jgi:outer membrane lipoprotein-sorting protein
LAATPGCSQSENASAQEPALEKDGENSGHREIEKKLQKMHDATAKLKSCQATVSYLFIQDPDLLDSKTIKTGTLYYHKSGDRSRLRIRFDEMKEEDFEPEKRREEFLFDGVWLTRIDFKLKQIDRLQKAPEDSPMDVFELISHNFPLIGFSDIKELTKDFDIQLPKDTDSKHDCFNLLLTVKKGSKYENEYSKIDFQADGKTFMPQRIVAYSSQGDIYDIKFSVLELNKKLKNSVFTIETPSDFRENIEPLNEKS